MNEGDLPADDLSPAERRLAQHLELLQASPPKSPALVPQVIRSVRWQRSIREPLVLVGSVAGALLDGLALVFGRPKDRS